MKSAKSIRAKLLQLSKKQGIDFQSIATRYIHERLLYRLSVSPMAPSFLLKGGNFIYAIQGLESRPTTDVDLLGKNTQNNAENIKDIFSKLLAVPQTDFVIFDVTSIQTTIINEQNEYNGIRLSLLAEFDTIQQNIQIDIGFGDTITPKAVQLDFPVLLNEMPIPKIWAYTAETVIAEKLQAIVVLAQLNSRMKDFYDIYSLYKEHSIDEEILKQAITNTFKHRNTSLEEDHSIFSDDFSTDKKRLQMWKNYVKKIKVAPINFTEVMNTIKEVAKKAI